MISYNADAFFAIGKTHMVCQDYARAGFLEGTPYVVLCDGCSSSPDTDFGARLLAASAVRSMPKVLMSNLGIGPYESEILKGATQSYQTLGLSHRALDSTLLLASWGVHKGYSGVRVSLRGDGVVAARRRSREFELHQVEHLRGAPLYLNYDCDPERFSGYLAEFGDEGLSRVFLGRCGEDFRVEPGNPPSLRERENPMSSAFGWLSERTTEFQGHPQDWFFSAYDYDLVVILSDGAASFQRLTKTGTSRHLTAISLEEVVAHVLDIKGSTGSFLQRRCHKFLTKFCVENGWQHSDDFSAAAISMEERDG